MIAHDPQPTMPVGPKTMPPNDATLIALAMGPSRATIASGRCANRYVALYGYPDGARWRLATPDECAEHEAEALACERAYEQHGLRPGS